MVDFRELIETALFVKQFNVSSISYFSFADNIKRISSGSLTYDIVSLYVEGLLRTKKNYSI